ncbi:MAG: hypothetical protein IPF78_15435 [Flavobacteriales bacterium]|nr:hypothetical protein [Flavobacteriales bacterium]
MALTLALVSFSCTGPILGSLLAGAHRRWRRSWQLTAGIGAFGLALALPFALFAMFPGWLNSPAPFRKLAEQREGGARFPWKWP